VTEQAADVLSDVVTLKHPDKPGAIMLEPECEPGWRLVLSRPDPTTRELLGVELLAEALADDDNHPARCGWSPEALSPADRILVEQWQRLPPRAVLPGPQLERLVLERLAARGLLEPARRYLLEPASDLVN
jgi:hypothetical protein